MMRRTFRFPFLFSLLILVAGPAAAQKIENYRKLEFMAGCWEATTGKDQTVEEVWSTPTETLMVGYTRYFTKGKATTWDFNFIQRTDSTVILVETPHGDTPDTFRIRSVADEVGAWERQGTEFPGLVMYRKASNGDLIVRLEAPPTVSQPSVEVRFSRKKCPGQK
jgi:hypothetical protein